MKRQATIVLVMGTARWAAPRLIPMALACVALMVSPAYADPFTVGSILTIDNAGVREYTSQGTLIQHIPVPIPGSPAFRDVLDGVTDRQGRLHVFNMSSSGSYLSTYTPSTAVWSHHAIPEYPNTFGSIDTGDMGIFGDYVFAGLVRIDLRDMSHTAFTTSVFGGSTSSVGRDGLLYVAAAGSPSHEVAVLNPLTLKELRTLSLRSALYNGGRVDVTGVTAEQDGTLLVTDINSVLFRYSPTGQELGYIQPTQSRSSLLDIDLNDSGQIVAGYRLDALLLSDSSLNSSQVIDLPVLDSPHVAFVQSPVPEPSSLALLTTGALVLLGGRWWRHRLRRVRQLVR